MAMDNINDSLLKAMNDGEQISNYSTFSMAMDDAPPPPTFPCSWFTTDTLVTLK